MTTIKPHPTLQKTTADGRTWNDILKYITAGYTINAAHLLEGPDVWTRLIPEASTQPKIRPYNSILHTNAGTSGASSLWGWITQSTVTGEPHCQVGYVRLEQYMPFNVRADCNYSANAWSVNGELRGAVSFESQDNGSATLNTTPWTLVQLRHFVGALTALCVCYGIGCNQPVTWDGTGIGHHVLFPYQGLTVKSWTNVRGKTCPGTARILQMAWIRNEVANKLAAFSEHTGWTCRGLS